MPQYWEIIITEFIRQSSALAVLLIDGDQTYSSPGSFNPSELTSLVKLAENQPDLDPGHAELFNALQMDEQPLLVHTHLLSPGVKALLAFPIDTRLSVAQGQSQRFVERIQSPVPPLTKTDLTDLKPRLNSRESQEHTWQEEFLSLFMDLEKTDQTKSPNHRPLDDGSTRPVQLDLNAKEEMAATSPKPNAEDPSKPYWFQVF